MYQTCNDVIVFILGIGSLCLFSFFPGLIYLRIYYLYWSSQRARFWFHLFPLLSVYFLFHWFPLWYSCFLSSPYFGLNLFFLNNNKPQTCFLRWKIRDPSSFLLLASSDLKFPLRMYPFSSIPQILICNVFIIIQSVRLRFPRSPIAYLEMCYLFSKSLGIFLEIFLFLMFNFTVS